MKFYLKVFILTNKISFDVIYCRTCNFERADQHKCADPGCVQPAFPGMLQYSIPVDLEQYFFYFPSQLIPFG